MVLNLRKVVSNWPGVVKVINKNNLKDKEYILAGTDEQLGAMWLGYEASPVEVRYVGKLPDGRFASYLIMSIWDDGYYNLNWKFAAETSPHAQQVSGSRAFVLVFDTFENDNIKFTIFYPEDDSFDSNTKEVSNTDVSHKIAGAA